MRHGRRQNKRPTAVSEVFFAHAAKFEPLQLHSSKIVSICDARKIRMKSPIVFALLLAIFAGASAEEDVPVAAVKFDVRAELVRSRAQMRVLQKLEAAGVRSIVTPQENVCNGDNSCCCRAGSYGYCTNATECTEIGGVCTSQSTAGCGQ